MGLYTFNFPVTAGPDLTHNGGNDSFVAKVNASGTALVYCGYIGGSGDDRGYGIAVDTTGNAYVTGYTYSTEATFPVIAGPDLTYNGNADAFVSKVNASGTALVYCGYIGGSGYDYGQGIAVDTEGNAYVTGYTNSIENSFPVTVGPDLTNGGTYDAFVAKIHYEYLTSFTITASAGQNGSISPSGSVLVEQGSSRTFTMAPDLKYLISDVIVDGKSIGAVTTYTFTNVTADHTITVVFGMSIESFETGNFNTYPWQSSGAAPWIVQGIIAKAGTYAAQAPISLEGNQSSSLSVDLCVDVATDITFWLKVSSEKDYDILTFKIDGIEKGHWSGEVDWSKLSYPLSVGEHTFSWTYSKDAEVSKGSDTAWIDEIIFPPKAHPCMAKNGNFFVIPNKKGSAAVIYLED